ncbi:DUF4157 domain-containing protein [Pseudomonadota bacterium]
MSVFAQKAHSEQKQSTAPCSKPGMVASTQRNSIREIIQTKPQPVSDTTPLLNDSGVSEGGQPIDANTRAFFEPRFGSDFGNVRIHNDNTSAATANTLNAKAFTYRNHIAFNTGEYSPESNQGRRLLAHELSHVMQQRNDSDLPIQRFCSDDDFCKPYDTQEEIDDAEWWINNTYMVAEGLGTFGTEVKNLYESYLSRTKGDTLTPEVFNNPSSYLVSAFRESGDTTDDVDKIISMVGKRLIKKAPVEKFPDNEAYFMPLSRLLSDAELENRPINYSNPFSVAGHIAGGIGSSDAGNDYRKITDSVAIITKTALSGDHGYITVEISANYEVFDAIDFCPGDCGSPMEQLITIPMSRLEASGAAYDVPFKVIFSTESRKKSFNYGTAPRRKYEKVMP